MSIIKTNSNHTIKAQSKPPMDNSTKYFICLSVIFYGLSLYFPAFGFWNNDKIDWYSGLYISSASPIAWFGLLKGNIGVIAVYANYIYVLVLLSTIKNIDRKFLLYSSYFMLILSSFSISFRDIGGEISSPLGEKIEFWGYGALFWYLSLITISYPIIIYHLKGSYAKLNNFIAFLILLVLLIFCYQNNLFNHANIQEKERYFDKKIALTTKQLSGVEFVPITNIKVDEHTVFEFIDNIERRYDRSFTRPSQYQYGDNFYIEHPNCYGSCGVITEVVDKKKVDYYVVYDYDENLEYHSTYKLLDANKNIIWQGQSKYIKHEIYPRYEAELSKLWTHLNKSGHKINDIVKDWRHKNYKNQVFNNKQPCLFTSTPDKMLNIVNINGKTFIIDNHVAGYTKAVCSDDYIIVYEHKTNILGISSIYLFDKNTVTPIKSFDFSSHDKVEWLNTQTDHLELQDFYLDIQENVYEEPIIMVKTQMGDYPYK
ncbi:hypothetical protein [Moraxella oblonga]|uniref:hypothetical protein n=1 Tax=Moraxella oblonga TaxID=200413 RepID=UPI00082B9862|nr:hypothetical protein [Moraxella oblonga]